LAHAQDRGSLLGKILRIDPRRNRVQVYASGLRNPWRFSFDGADLLVGDVGQGAREEIDRIRAPGANLGWPCLEGTRPNLGCSVPAALPPVLEHGHEDGFCAITGGYVVRDPGLPTLAGRYLYGDFCRPALRSVTLDAPADDRPEPLSVPRLTSFGHDACDRLYVASLDGPVYRLQDGPAAPCRPVADTAAPRLSVRVRRWRLRVRCNEPCRITARGRIRGAGRFRTVRRRLTAAGRTTFRLEPRPGARRRLRRRGPATAVVRVTARDAVGNVRRARARTRVSAD
jgi:hypothetical protein